MTFYCGEKLRNCVYFARKSTFFVYDSYWIRLLSSGSQVRTLSGVPSIGHRQALCEHGQTLPKRKIRYFHLENQQSRLDRHAEFSIWAFDDAF